jgi:uncharacterized protein (UPF0333 family)
MAMQKAQAAFEYMIIVILVLLFLLPVWNYAATTQSNTGTHLSASYAKNAADRITYSAGFVDSQGPPSKIILNVYVPKDVENATIINKTVIFRVRSGSDYSDVASMSIAEINGTLPATEGNYNIQIESTPSGVQINPV